MALKGDLQARAKANPYGFARMAATILLLAAAGAGLLAAGLLIAGDESSRAQISTSETHPQKVGEPDAPVAVASDATDAATDAEPAAPPARPASQYAFAWPVPGSITQGITAMHGGIDIRAATGEPVTAVRDGKVRFAGGDICCVYGYYVIVDHDEGWSTLYGHLSEISVKAGDRIEQGDIVGLAGNTGRSDGAHLHLELWSNGSPVNPLSYLEPARYYVPVFVEAEIDESTPAPTPTPLPREQAIDSAVRWMEGPAGDYSVQRASCFAIAAGPNWSVSCSARLIGCQADVCDAMLEACVVGPLSLVEATCSGYSPSGSRS